MSQQVQNAQKYERLITYGLSVIIDRLTMRIVSSFQSIIQQSMV